VRNSQQDAHGIGAELLFSTPLFRRVLPSALEVNGYLRELLLARETSDARSGRQYSNVGGWHSEPDLQESWEDEMRLVLGECQALASEATRRLLDPDEILPPHRYALTAWANVSRQGHYNVPHVHMATWSAVYYVSVPAECADAGVTGALELLDPRPPAAMVDMPGRFFRTRHIIKPQPGLLVLFPASIMHLVHPFQGSGERISIACDLTIRTG
jgi:uncharacterized protein (TIGR02466 family)